MDVEVVIKSDLIRAAMLCINPKDECRYYIQGVRIDGAQIAATDGHRLFVGLVEEPITERITVPYEVLKLASSAMRKSDDIIIRKHHDDWLLFTADWRFIFKPIDGKFPEYQKLMDAPLGGEKPSRFNPAYYNDLGKMAKVLTGNKDNFQVFQCGDEPAGVKFQGRDDCKMKIMPMRPLELTW